MKRAVFKADALEWLPLHRDAGAVITSLPDPEELKGVVGDYPFWFRAAAAQAMLSTSKGAPTIFYQTDRKYQGRTISKAALLFDAAGVVGRRVLWHKIVLRRDVGAVDIHRPGYTHLIAFGDAETRPGPATPDVIARGAMNYSNAMGANVARLACEFAKRSTSRVLDPFCGSGTVLAAAEQLGMAAVGVDIDPKMVALAKRTKGGSA